jgi:hypothetical protein
MSAQPALQLLAMLFGIEAGHSRDAPMILANRAGIHLWKRRKT